jgi:hypothetical protein
MSATFNQLGHRHIFVFDTHHYMPLLQEQGISMQQQQRRDFMPAVGTYWAGSLAKKLPNDSE